MANARQVLAIKFNRKAARMLVEFVNMEPDLSKFVPKWGGIFGLSWSQFDIKSTQRIIRSLWQGKKAGIEGFQIGLSLGLNPPNYAEGHEPMIQPPLIVDFRAGGFRVIPRDLEQLIWLVLLQHSRHLGVCQNKKSPGYGWPHPYFIKYRPEQKYCCDRCAAPAKREAKRQWWNRNRAK